jgi:hypothetical protein
VSKVANNGFCRGTLNKLSIPVWCMLTSIVNGEWADLNFMVVAKRMFKPERGISLVFAGERYGGFK